MPNRATNQRQIRFEDILELEVLRKGHGQMAFVTTGHGSKRWFLYVRDAGKATEALKALFAKPDALPVEMFSMKDPDWSQYRTFMTRLRQTPAW